MARQIGEVPVDGGPGDSLYIRDPNGVGIEIHREDPGVFDGEALV